MDAPSGNAAEINAAEINAAEINAAEIFWSAHDGLPREAPGSADTTRLLLRLAGLLPHSKDDRAPASDEPGPAESQPRPRVVDIGCGTGPASMLLAAEAGADVVAVDNHPPFLAQLRADAEAGGLGARIQTLTASMDDLPLPDGCADLVWAEGSAYVMGVDAALSAWRRLLAPGGVLVFTDATWTTDTPAAEARVFWEPGYPAMRTIAATVAAVTAAGWTVAATYLLPESDWAEYYGPLAARIAQLRVAHPEAAQVLDQVGHEIDIRRDHGTDYGYVGYVLRSTRPRTGPGLPGASAQQSSRTRITPEASIADGK